MHVYDLAKGHEKQARETEGTSLFQIGRLSSNRTEINNYLYFCLFIFITVLWATIQVIILLADHGNAYIKTHCSNEKLQQKYHLNWDGR